MTLSAPILDHVVVDVRERMDEAMRTYQRLGFRLTPRGHHTLGSSNHLAMYATDYLELLGFGEGGKVRAEIEAFAVGLNGLVFKADDADVVYREAAAAGLPIMPVQAFSRPVDLGGEAQDARFRTTRLDPTKIAMGRVYFCEHLTPELVWRPEWQSHPNGARAISRVVVATPDPKATAALFTTLFGRGAMTERDSRIIMIAGETQIELATPDGVADEFGAAAADPAGRGEYIAALGLRVSSLAQAAQVLSGAPGVGVERGRIVVPARAACNATLTFSE